MLLLTRKINQKIIIGDDIEITIIDMREGRVKIGIKAPHNVPVMRQELYSEVQNENKEAILDDAQMVLPNITL